MSGPVGFVGRERELSRLRAALGGDTRMVLVAGDAGVGKTRFAGEGMRRAAAGGVVPVWGGCLPLAGKLPLLPVAETLGELGRLDGGGLLEAALGMVPPYVRAEVERLLPQLGPGVVSAGGRREGWRRERLFAGVAELLGAVARRCGLVLVIEDVHWADSATLDCLTLLARAGDGQLTVVVTCRSDEPRLDAHVAGWLAHARGRAGTEEIRLDPLSRNEVAEEIAALVGGPPSPRLVDEVYARAEGNPFFTEQLVAAAQEQASDGVLRAPAGLPARLAELLVARAGRCGGDARVVLEGLAVAGRPLTEDLLAGITRFDLVAVRGALRELGSARLLADNSPEGAYRLRHALLAEAVAADLLSGERVALHERTAQALQTTGDQALAAEAAGHWAAAGRAAEELPARVAAAGAAERVFGYAEAAAHWQRAIELCQQLPDAARAAGVDLPRLYLRAIDALDVAGDGQQAGALAEEAYRRFAGHPDRPTAAVVHLRAAYYRGLGAPDAGFPLIKEALRLFEREPPSAEHAEAWFHYGSIFLFHAEGRLEESRQALRGSLEIAEAAGATALMPRILAYLAVQAATQGQVGEGFAILDRGRALAEATDGEGAVWVDVIQSDFLLKTGKFQAAADVARRGLQAARRVGRHTSFTASVLPANASEALLALGRTAEAAALIDPLTTGPPDRDHFPVHTNRAEIDLLRGDIEAAAKGWQQINAVIGSYFSIDFAREAAQRAAELALWAGRPDDGLHEVQRALALFQSPDLTFACGRPLAVGMRACADLAERARARCDGHEAGAALAAAGDLASWVDRMGGVPFADHPLMAAISADRATWDAERTRLAGASDPAAWSAAAKTWEDLGCPHRAGYAWWRCAEARLAGGQPAPAATPALRTAAAAAEGHAPLLAQIRALAQRARISLQTARAASSETARPAEAPAPYGLTERELAVLRLLTAGRTNAQIGAELYISPRTAGVHVTNILRKLGVSNRVQAAALAERAGLRHPQHG
jgi:DNA-binding CsgD family transcriptional regulator